MPVKKPVKKKVAKKKVAKTSAKKKTLKLYSLGFQGLALGGSSLILAHSLVEAMVLLRKSAGKPIAPWQKEVKEFVVVPQVLSYDDGDY